MKKRTLLNISWLALLLIGMSCDKDNDPVEESHVITVQGNVTETQSGAPIADVNVSSGIASTTTTSDGRYSINASKDGILVFKKDGYEDEDRNVSNQSKLDITMTRIDDEIETIVLSGLTTGDMTLTPDKNYEISQKFVVANGHTVTIEPGTIIKGREGTGSVASAMIVARGGKVIAEGTPDKPIVFTSVLDNIQPGEKWGDNLTENDREKWGGLIILGKAPISAGDGDTEAQIEGIPADEEFGKYGGDNPADNSGIFKYISVRHGGALIGEGNEINGITLGGVGHGTVFENIEVSGTLDDGVEFFGGTVNAKNILVTYQGDDAIDIDQNYSGTIENVLVVHGGDDSDKALEIDGPEGTLEDGLFTIDKGTFVFVGGSGTGGDFKSKAQGTLKNSVFIGYGDMPTVLIRESFDADNNCAAKTDAYDYLVAEEPRLIFDNVKIVSNSTLSTLFNLYSSNCEDSITQEMRDLMINVLSNSNTSAVNEIPENIGADISVFDWTWSAARGFLP